MEKVIAYVDGFNLYYGLKSKGWKKYYWLNVKLLAQNLLKSNQNLTCVKYFTSRVSSTKGDPKQSKRQNTYLEALETLRDCYVYFGHYLKKPSACKRCGFSWNSHEEKRTDVNISVAMLVDAFQNKFDTALLISGDSDLFSPLHTVRDIFTAKRIVVAFPPLRHSTLLQNAANNSFTIGRKKIAASLLPDEVRKNDGYILQRPDRWR